MEKGRSSVRGIVKGLFFSCLPLSLGAFLIPLNGVWASGLEMTYGGKAGDDAWSVAVTSDNGFIVAGQTESFGSGKYDGWLLKTDATGKLLWQNTFGGIGNDVFYFVRPTQDGGFIACGSTTSTNIADKTDAWVVKVTQTGQLEWAKAFGGGASDEFYEIYETADQGFIAAGHSSSFSASLLPDPWVVKLDKTGNVVWQKTYGGAAPDYAYSIKQINDGGYVVAGTTASFGTGVYGTFASDILVLRLDGNGNLLWSKVYGGEFPEEAVRISLTSDSGYVISGTTGSFSDNLDLWLVKLNASGDILWQKRYGGAKTDYAADHKVLPDGGIIMTGKTYNVPEKQYDADSQCAPVDKDIFLIKTDAEGNIVWSKTYGGLYTDESAALEQTENGGFVVAGSMGAANTADGNDIWLFKTDSNGTIGYSCDMSELTLDASDTVSDARSVAVTAAYKTVQVFNTTVTPVETNVTGQKTCSLTEDDKDRLELFAITPYPDNIFMLGDQVKVGLKVITPNPEKKSALFLTFWSYINSHTDLWYTYLGQNQLYKDWPTPVYPENHPLSSYNFECDSDSPCILNFPSTLLGPGDYSIMAFISDFELTFLPSSITGMIFSIRDKSYEQTCRSAGFAAANPCFCDGAYVEANPDKCLLNAATVAGEWLTTTKSIINNEIGDDLAPYGKIVFTSDGGFEHEYAGVGPIPYFWFKEKGSLFFLEENTVSYATNESWVRWYDYFTDSIQEIHCVATDGLSGSCSDGSHVDFIAYSGTLISPASNYFLIYTPYETEYFNGTLTEFARY